MSVLSDTKIFEKIYQGDFSIEPFDSENIQPASIDLTLGTEISVPKKGVDIIPFPPFDKEKMASFHETFSLKKEGYILKPNEFVLVKIREKISLSPRLLAHVKNRSSLVLSGINAAFVDYINPGYSGNLTIGIKNSGSFSFTLQAGLRICQLVLEEVKDVNVDYAKRSDAKYQGYDNISHSKLSEDKELIEWTKNKDSSDISLSTFLEQKIQKSSKSFFDNLTIDQKKKLGLIE